MRHLEVTSYLIILIYYKSNYLEYVVYRQCKVNILILLWFFAWNNAPDMLSKEMDISTDREKE